MVEQSYSVEVEPFEGADNRSCFNQQKVQMDQPKLTCLPSSGLMTNQETLRACYIGILSQYLSVQDIS